MNGSEMLRLIDSISRDRNVDKETLLTDLEQAMAVSYTHLTLPTILLV